MPPDDISQLYRSLSKPLEEIVRLHVLSVPRPVVEDACQFAWSRLIHNHARVQRDGALSWLGRTAVHEAFKLLRREGQCVSLDSMLDTPAGPVPDELVERRERLGELRVLPERQQRLVWLHALGLNYAEIALQTGYTTRTVERQLLRAKRTLR